MDKATFNFIVDFVWLVGPYRMEEQFDFPDYFGMPRQIIKTLSPEAVDAMQDVFQHFETYPSKNNFRTAYLQRLSEIGGI